MDAEYLPASHNKHADAAVVSEYLPATHVVHCEGAVDPKPGKNLPSPHCRQVSIEVAAKVFEYVPRSQEVQK